MLALAVGALLMGCAGADTREAAQDHETQPLHTDDTTVPTQTERPGDHGHHPAETEVVTGTEDPHAHHHHDDEPDEVVTTGPPRPADPDVECGTTLLPDGEQVIRYCDEGHAQFTVGDTEVMTDGARCEDRGGFFLAHFGTNYSDEEAARGEYLGLILEEVPSTGTSSPRISALELTLSGYRQVVSDASVQMTHQDPGVEMTLTGELPDGRSFEIEAHCSTTGS